LWISKSPLCLDHNKILTQTSILLGGKRDQPMQNHVSDMSCRSATHRKFPAELRGIRARDAGTVESRSLTSKSLKCWNTCDSPAKDKRVNVLSALVSVDCLEIADVADDLVLIDDTIASQHVTALSRDVKGFSA